MSFKMYYIRLILLIYWHSQDCYYYLLNFHLTSNNNNLSLYYYEFDFQSAFKSQLCTKLSTITIVSRLILCKYMYNTAYPG